MLSFVKNLIRKLFIYLFVCIIFSSVCGMPPKKQAKKKVSFASDTVFTAKKPSLLRKNFKKKKKQKEVVVESELDIVTIFAVLNSGLEVYRNSYQEAKLDKHPAKIIKGFDSRVLPLIVSWAKKDIEAFESKINFLNKDKDAVFQSKIPKKRFNESIKRYKDEKTKVEKILKAAQHCLKKSEQLSNKDKKSILRQN